MLGKEVEFTGAKGVINQWDQKLSAFEYGPHGCSIITAAVLTEVISEEAQFLPPGVVFMFVIEAGRLIAPRLPKIRAEN